MRCHNKAIRIERVFQVYVELCDKILIQSSIKCMFTHSKRSMDFFKHPTKFITL